MTSSHLRTGLDATAAGLKRILGNLKTGKFALSKQMTRLVPDLLVNDCEGKLKISQQGLDFQKSTGQLHI